MAGLVPAIHAVRLPECLRLARPSVSGQSESAVRWIGVDGRDKPGHDGVWALRSAPTAPAWQLHNSTLRRVGGAISAVKAFSPRSHGLEPFARQETRAVFFSELFGASDKRLGAHSVDK